MSNRRREFLAASLLLPAWLSACTASRPEERSRRRIVATTPMLGDLAKRIAPDADNAHLFGEGVDPHLYKPTRSDIVELVRADVIVTNGLMLEGRMGDAFHRAAESGRTVVAVGDSLPPDRLLHAEGSHGHPDPHIWMDPSLWSLCGEVLAHRLGAADDRGSSGYLERAARFSALATELEGNAVGAIDSVPADRRILVSAHDAFGYFGKRFGLEVHAIQGISTESEAGLADVESLVTFLVERRVPAVFVESTVSPRTIQALIAGAHARGHSVTIGGELFSDSMGPAGTPEGTWPGMLAHNVSTIVTALGGTVPAGGLIPKEFASART
jgi:manganese/zinc/iron transport system substrate-binding protein